MITSTLLSQIPHLLHGFGTAHEPRPQFLETLGHAKWQQVHGVNCVEIHSLSQECGPSDAFYTRKAGIVTAVITADCVPLLLAHESGEWIAAIHAGWRGTLDRIVRHVWKTLSTLTERPAREWKAVIGPSIHPCCYPVDPELSKKFHQTFQSLNVIPENHRLNLPAIQEAELKDLGFEHIETLPYCTHCCLEPTFFSVRKNATSHRQWSAIVRLP